MNPYIFIFGTLFFIVYGQIVLKWRLSGLKVVLPEGFFDKIIYLIKLILDPFIFSGFISAFVASLFWMAAMTKFEITHAYPFMSLAAALVFIMHLGFACVESGFVQKKNVLNIIFKNTMIPANCCIITPPSTPHTHHKSFIYIVRKLY